MHNVRHNLLLSRFGLFLNKLYHNREAADIKTMFMFNPFVITTSAQISLLQAVQQYSEMKKKEGPAGTVK